MRLVLKPNLDWVQDFQEIVMALPSPSEDACFDPSVFQSEEFKVDEFVSSCKKRVSTEHLHDDLRSYFTVLKAAMVELINKDYADFLDLSANLVGMDKQIESLALPMSQLHQEILIIKHSLEKVSIGLEGKMSAREEIRNKKLLLKKVIESVDSVELLERLLDRLTNTPSDQREQELDRLAMEFNKLRHNASKVIDIPLMNKMEPRIEVITRRLQTILEDMLCNSLKSRDHDLLLHTLQTYSFICNMEAAEATFCHTVVTPALKEIISPKAVLTNSQGLKGVYNNIMKFIPNQCGFILEVSNGIHGFDILVNAIWPEIVSIIETRASVIFNPGNPDTFYKNFSITMTFLKQFESQCTSIEQVRSFRSHPAYNAFLSKWSLPVYFQIRFQEIGGKLENNLELPLKGKVSSDTPFTLEVFSVLYSCIYQSWSDGVFISSLAHRFWKLTLQLITRVKLWLSEVFDEHKQDLSVNDCVRLIHDIDYLQQETSKLFENHIKKHLQSLLGEEKTIVQKGVLANICHSFTAIIQTITVHATTVLGQQSIKNLEPVHTIPRLYRRTNREVPKKPSGYVHSIVKPLMLIDYSLLKAEQTREWKETVVKIVTEKYLDITSEVMENVKRTEDSLLKLKRNRRSVQVEQVNEGMSDDNKIRLQLAIDIETYAEEVKTVLPTDHIPAPFLQKLLDIAAIAKTTATAN